jgi:glycosyltransferase involved in cell wall biosynthesis
MNMPIVEITVPVLDEESTLEVQIRKIRVYLDAHLSNLGTIVIVIADNGSTDRTQDIGIMLESQLANVRYLRLELRGVGRALKASWDHSTADVVGYMDLDLATDLKHLEAALTPLLKGSADVVTGSRLARGAIVRGRSVKREITSRVFNALVRIYFRTSFSDGMCGFKFVSRPILAQVRVSGADSHGWFFATELLAVSDYLGLRVLDLPVEWTDDPNSKVKIARLSLEYLKAMRSLKARLPQRKRRA